MRAALLPLCLVLLAPPAAAQEAADASAASARASEWREKVSRRLAEHKAKEPKPSVEAEACRDCVAGQSLVGECFRAGAGAGQASARDPKYTVVPQRERADRGYREAARP